LNVKPFLVLAAVILAAAAVVYKEKVWQPSAAYVEEIAPICMEVGEELPLILAVIQTESRFREDAVSRSGALGLMQVMPDTGRWMADRLGMVGYSTEKLREREWNLTIGINYVHYLRQSFPGNLAKALAAYNAGPNRVKGWLDAGQWDGSQARLDDIPFSETRNYVKKVLKAYDGYKKTYPQW
jgi:soluble lytic murein transglycosylase